jgi:hypothetical protein
VRCASVPSDTFDDDITAWHQKPAYFDEAQRRDCDAARLARWLNVLRV